MIESESMNKICSETIYITLTSWKGRIKNIITVLDSIAANNVAVEVELNLSEEEFTNKEKDLPEDLLNYSKLPLKIFWVGRNTKSFKKLIPTMMRHYNENCFIITVDDDVIYENDFIEKFVKAAQENPEAIISNNMCRGCYQSQQCVNGALTLYRPKFFTPFLWEGLIQVVVDTNEDDWWYSFNLWLFGQRQIKYIPTQLTFFNEVGEHQYQQNNTQQVLVNYWRWLINQKKIIELSPVQDNTDAEYEKFIADLKAKRNK